MSAATGRHHGQSADETRFVDLYERYSRLLHGYCARRTSPSQAADAVAEVFLVTWRRLDDVPDGDAALPWLYRVAYRVVSHQWRSRTRNLKLTRRLGGLVQLDPPGPDLVILRREEDQLILQAAARLKPIEREILRLTLWEQLSHADVGMVLGLEQDAVKQRAYRARRRLAAEYQKLTRSHRPPAALKGGQR